MGRINLPGSKENKKILLIILIIIAIIVIAIIISIISKTILFSLKIMNIV
ncbi:hypothetical protein ABHA01_03255 [Clostridium paraputrificum]